MQPPNQLSDDERARRWRLPLSLTTAAALLLELSLTRLFSVVLFYHYAFLVVSMALLGLGCGGMLARALRERLVGRVEAAASLGCLLSAAALWPCLSYILDTRLAMVSDWQHIGRLAGLYLVCTVPFALCGFVVAAVMSAASGSIGSLYFYDLCGASLGDVLFVPVMGWLGGVNAVIASGVLLCLAAAAWSPGRTRGVAALLALAASLFVFANRSGGLFDVRYTRGQPLKDEVFVAWNSFSRVSVYRDANALLWIELDGGAGTWLTNTRLDGDAGAAFAKSLGGAGPELGFRLARPAKVLVIGSGGGYDLARAVGAGAGDVTAVEINPIIARDIMLGAFRDYSRGIYARPEVRVVIEDGRSFLGRTAERYDVIQLSQVDTWASSAAGAYALTENHLYTVEALGAYLDHLRDGGVVSITRWEFEKPRETLRLLSVALEALARAGVERPGDHVAVVLERVGGRDWPRMGTLLMGRRPLSATFLAGLRRHLGGTSMELAVAPGVDGGLRPFVELARSRDRAGFVDRYELDVSPVFDDRPFFFFSDRWSSVLGPRAAAEGDALGSSAQALLLALLAISLAAVGLFLLLPVLLWRGASELGHGALRAAGFFVCVGLGYALVEIALIQRLLVFLGHPALSLVVVVFGMLLSSSLGSRASQALALSQVNARVRRLLCAIVALVVLYGASLGVPLGAAQGASQPLKIVICLALILPLGFLMGFPFPAALRLCAARRPGLVEWSWATNAAASVLGSVLTIVVCVTAGIGWALLCGAAAYGGAMLLLPWVGPRAAAAPP